MTATATWQDVLKENLVGRVIATNEMGVSFRGTIDRVETNGDFLYIYPKAWFRLYCNWEPWETQKSKELGHPEPVMVRVSGENTASLNVTEETGEIWFYVFNRGEVWIRYHDCEIQYSDDGFFEEGSAVSNLVYLRESGRWVIQTKIVFCDSRKNNITTEFTVRHCPECGEKLPKF